MNIKKFADAYRNVAQGALGKTAMTVSNEAKTEIGVNATRPLELSELKKLPDGDSRIMDNIYMRGQLLSAIRESLMTLNADGSRTGLGSKMARAFFKQAEERLFGKLEKNRQTGKMEFGVKTAGADLDALTVKELVDNLNEFVAQKQSLAEQLKGEMPNLSPVHAKALATLSLVDLVEVVGLSEDEARNARIEGFVQNGSRLDFCVKVSMSGSRSESRSIPVYFDKAGNLFILQHRKDFVRQVNDKFAFGKGANYADRLPNGDLQEVSKLLNRIRVGKQTKYAALYARSGLKGSPYESYLRNAFMTMLPRALERARKIQPQGAITFKTWWNALLLEDTGVELPVKSGAEAQANALMDALFERVLADFRKLEDLTEDDVQKLKAGDDGQDENKVFARFTQFLSCDALDYEDAIKIRTNPNAKFGPMDVLDLKVSVDTLENPDFGVPALSKTINGDHRAAGTTFFFGGKKVFQMGVSGKTEASRGIYRLRAGKFSMKQIGLMVYALNHCEHSIPPLFKGVGHQANIDVAIQAVGNENAPEMKVTYTIPLLVKKGGNTVELTTRNIVHTVVYSQDGSSRCESLKLENASGREQNKTMTLKEFGEMRMPKIDLPAERSARKLEVARLMERIVTLDSSLEMYQKELEEIENLSQLMKLLMVESLNDEESKKLKELQEKYKDESQMLQKLPKLKRILELRKKAGGLTLDERNELNALNGEIKGKERARLKEILRQMDDDPLGEKKKETVRLQITRVQKHREGYLAKLNAPENKDIRREVLEERLAQVRSHRGGAETDLKKLDENSEDYARKKALIEKFSAQETMLSKELES